MLYWIYVLQKQINAVPFNVIKSIMLFTYRLLFSSVEHIGEITCIYTWQSHCDVTVEQARAPILVDSHGIGRTKIVSPS